MEPDKSSNQAIGPGTMCSVLNIAEVVLNQQSVIGIAACPGRHHLDGRGHQQQDNLAADLKTLNVWGAQALISLVEEHEFSHLGVPDIAAVVRTTDIIWYHLPIADRGIPADAFLAAWKKHGPAIVPALEQGARMIIHCAGGLGRSGMIAAKLLTTCGVAPDEAIRQVRNVRPGAIETREQENYVFNGPAL